MASEEKLKQLAQVREILRKVEDDLDRALQLIEPYPAPVIKSWLRSAKHRVYFMWSGPLSYPSVLELARRR